MGINRSFVESWEEVRASYRVPDLLPETARLVFLLESPHVHELVQGVPVAGLSGGSMTKHLLGMDGKLGPTVRANPEQYGIGLMNVCQIPMQLAAYSNPRVEAQYPVLDAPCYGEFFPTLEGLRADRKKGIDPADWAALQGLILDDLRSRLHALEGRELYLVPCGSFAQKYFQLADVQVDSWTVLEEVPHPSYNNWGKERYRDKIDELLTIYRNLERSRV